jgi:hypothetical protein
LRSAAAAGSGARSKECFNNFRIDVARGQAAFGAANAISIYRSYA